MNAATTTNRAASPTLIMIRGVPGSGKSYVANALRESIGKAEVIVLDPDAIDYSSQEYAEFSQRLTADGVDAKLHPYRFLRANAHKAITAHKIIIWNQAFIDLDGFTKTVNNLQAFAIERNIQLPVLVVEVEIDEHTARARTAEREGQGGHGVPEEAFARFISQYASFSDKGYATVTINGHDNVAASVAAIKQALEKI